jgi:hypothetical protein
MKTIKVKLYRNLSSNRNKLNNKLQVSVKGIFGYRKYTVKRGAYIYYYNEPALFNSLRDFSNHYSNRHNILNLKIIVTSVERVYRF